MKIVQGDILAAPAYGVLAHGCNAQGKYQSGMAGQIRAMYPKAYDDYMAHYEKFGLIPGDVVYSEIHPDFTIANCITQKYYGRDKSVVYVYYEAVERSVRQAALYAKSRNLPLYFPRIGAGLANGDWGHLSGILARCTEDVSDVTLFTD